MVSFIYKLKFIPKKTRPKKTILKEITTIRSQMQIAKGTLVDGIASSEHLDSSGERIIIKGMDISSLERGEGTLTWEHKNENSSQTIGKILFAKKIYSSEDCKTERELHFWNLSQAPFVYIIGELFDGIGHQAAKDAAAMLEYDKIARANNKPLKNTINFSVEGAKLEKKGQEIVSSIARKVTLTVSPCNKRAIAEKLDLNKEVGVKKSLFKTEPFEVEILSKSGPSFRPYSSQPKINPTSSSAKPTVAAPKAVAAPKPVSPSPAPIKMPQRSIGKTKSGKDIFHNTKPMEYSGWTASDHSDAHTAHMEASGKTKNPALAERHRALAGWHNEAKAREDRKAQRLPNALAQRKAKLFGKALTAGSGDVAPANLSGGAALSKENLDSAAKTWPSYGKTLSFISKKMPQLDKSEAELLAKYMALRAMKRAEIELAKMSIGDIEKSKNVREQRAKVFGNDPNAPRLSEKRMKMMNQIRNYVQNKYGMNLETAQGKRDVEGNLREEVDLAHQPYDVFTPEGQKEEAKRLKRLKQTGEKRVDPKPHWYGSQMETQPSPDAAVHEAAHLDLAPEGTTPQQFQLDMDAAYARHGKEFGHAQGKRTAWEVQPMSIENNIRRELGLPANKASKKQLSSTQIKALNINRAKKGLPPLEMDPETGVELTFDDKRPRFVRGKDSKGRETLYDRQARLQSPETKQRVQEIREGSLKFDPQTGWYRASDTNALINLRGRGEKEEAKRRARQKLPPKKMAASEEMGKADDESKTFHIDDKLKSAIHMKGDKWTTSYVDHNGKRKHSPKDNLEHALAHIENVHGHKVDTSSDKFKEFEESTKMNKAANHVRGVNRPVNPHTSTQSEMGSKVVMGGGRIPSKNQDHMVPRLDALRNKQAKQIASNVLAEQRSMPKPNLPKNEQMGKSNDRQKYFRTLNYKQKRQMMDQKPESKEQRDKADKELKEFAEKLARERQQKNPK